MRESIMSCLLGAPGTQADNAIDVLYTAPAATPYFLPRVGAPQLWITCRFAWTSGRGCGKLVLERSAKIASAPDGWVGLSREPRGLRRAAFALEMGRRRVGDGQENVYLAMFR